MRASFFRKIRHTRQPGIIKQTLPRRTQPIRRLPRPGLIGLRKRREHIANPSADRE